MKRRYGMLALSVLASVALVLSSIWLLLHPGGRAESAQGGATKVVYMSAVEYKGSANTSTEPFPSVAPPSGGGYRLNEPDDKGNWSTSTYRWEPGAIFVNRGDKVELRIWGVNGAVHDAHIEGLVSNFTVQRGQLTIVSFTAKKAGTYKIHCGTHGPSMEALLVVLPYPSR